MNYSYTNAHHMQHLASFLLNPMGFLCETSQPYPVVPAEAEQPAVNAHQRFLTLLEASVTPMNLQRGDNCLVRMAGTSQLPAARAGLVFPRRHPTVQFRCSAASLSPSEAQHLLLTFSSSLLSISVMPEYLLQKITVTPEPLRDLRAFNPAHQCKQDT